MSKRLEMLEQMMQKGSEDPFVWYARAMELRSLERLEDSLRAFEEVEKRFPDYVPTYLMAGQVAEALGLRNEAAGFYDRGLERAAGKDPHAHSELTTARVNLGAGA